MASSASSILELVRSRGWREAALKLMELSDGALVTAFDTALGFRHGPKTIINAETLAVVFVSNDPLTRLYDLDIAEELRSDGHSGAVVTISRLNLATMRRSHCRHGKRGRRRPAVSLHRPGIAVWPARFACARSRA